MKGPPAAPEPWFELTRGAICSVTSRRHRHRQEVRRRSSDVLVFVLQQREQTPPQRGRTGQTWPTQRHEREPGVGSLVCLKQLHLQRAAGRTQRELRVREDAVCTADQHLRRRHLHLQRLVVAAAGAHQRRPLGQSSRCT